MGLNSIDVELFYYDIELFYYNVELLHYITLRHYITILHYHITLPHYITTLHYDDKQIKWVPQVPTVPGRSCHPLGKKLFAHMEKKFLRKIEYYQGFPGWTFFIDANGDANREAREDVVIKTLNTNAHQIILREQKLS